MRTRPTAALLTATAAALTLAACAVPETPPTADVSDQAVEAPVAPVAPAPVGEVTDGDGEATPRTDAAAPQPVAPVVTGPVASTTPGPLQDLLEAEGRWVLADERPPMPDPMAGAWDQPILGARGTAGVTCQDGVPNAYVIVAAEHLIRYTKLTSRGVNDPVENGMTGGRVTLAADEEVLVEFDVPHGPDGWVYTAYDLEHDHGLDLAWAGRSNAGPDAWRDVRPGQLGGAVTESDPLRVEVDWSAGIDAEYHDHYATFQLWAPNNPVAPGAEVTFTYTLDEHIPVELTVVAPDC